MTTLLFPWVGKVFIPNHLSLFQINYNYGGFLGDMVSCREHSPIPPKCTDGCGVRLPQFHTSAAAKTINSWQVLLNHGNMRSLLKQMRQNLWGATPEGSSQRDAVVLRRFSTDPFGVDGATLCQLAFLAPLWRDTNRFWRCRRAGKRRLLPSVPCLGRDKVRCIDPAFATELMCYSKLLCWIQAGAHSPASWVEGAGMWSASLQRLERLFAELSRAVSGLKNHPNSGAEVELWISTLFLEKHHLNCISKPFFFFLNGN